MKAITPVIALVMLLLITVGITGASYSWFGGLMSSQTKKAITIPPGGAYCSDGDIKVYVLNNGDAAITTQDIIVAQVDGVDVKGTPFFGDMRSGLVGYWKFDEAGGTTARDSSGNNNNGDLKPACPNCPEWKTGRSRNALNFDGVNDVITVPNSASLKSPYYELTLGAWIKPSDLSTGWHMILAKSEGALGAQYALGINGANLGIIIYDSNSVGYSYTYTGITAGVWQHVAGIFSASEGKVKLYINGVENSQITVAPDVGGFPDRYLNIGTRSAEYFNGAIDEVKIYNKAVGDVNVQPSSLGLIVNYPGAEGKHTVRVGTSSGVAESTVTCA